ncbi:MAG: 4-hydroxy-tetrahydrodipicolinate synthase [Methanomicrobiales archaeon]|nr:4-hydroxy-tetrahydrodipicolinate synthase [Methanomicrobiales archaeon]
MFEGVFPAIITPFKNDPKQTVDLDGLRSNIQYLLSQGVHGIVPCGSTGESATLSFTEHEKVIEVAIDTVNGRVPVLAGTGSNNTAEAIVLTKAAKDLGADGALVISPYYNKPNRSGLIKHYTRLADLDIPVVMYNVPGRTGQNLEPDLVAELAGHPNIVGIKEASGNLGQISRVIEETRGKEFMVTSGDDNLTLPIIALGGAGVISVAANVVPKEMVEMCGAAAAGDLDRARQQHYFLSPLFRALFIDTNPIPVKKAVELAGMAAGPVRLPLDDLDAAKTAQLSSVLSRYVGKTTAVTPKRKGAAKGGAKKGPRR